MHPRTLKAWIAFSYLSGYIINTLESIDPVHVDLRLHANAYYKAKKFLL